MTPPSDQFNDAGRASYNASLDSIEEVVAKVEFLMSYLAAQADLIESAKRWKGEAERADAEAKALREALVELDRWATRMPDAGLNATSPCYLWWFERPQGQVNAALAAAEPSDG